MNGKAPDALREASVALARQLAGLRAFDETAAARLEARKGTPHHYFLALRWGLKAARNLNQGQVPEASHRRRLSARQSAAVRAFVAKATGEGRPQRREIARRIAQAAVRSFSQEVSRMKRKKESKRFLETLDDAQFVSELLHQSREDVFTALIYKPAHEPLDYEKVREPVKLSIDGGHPFSGVFVKAPGDSRGQVLTAGHNLAGVMKKPSKMVTAFFPFLGAGNEKSWKRATVRHMPRRDIAAFRLKGDDSLKALLITPAPDEFDAVRAVGFGATDEGGSGQVAISEWMKVHAGGCDWLGRIKPDHKCLERCGFIALKILAGSFEDLCAQEASGVCDGDSGGPAYILPNSTWDDARRIVGINTCSLCKRNGMDCGPGGIFTRIDEEVVSFLKDG